jgi:hypothetical protein
VKKKPRKLQGKARLSKNGSITDLGLEQLCTSIEEGDAHPDDVRAAIKRIYKSQAGTVGGVPLTYYEWTFLCLGFARYSDGTLSLDQAFGVVRSHTGHPGVPVREQQRIARAIWAQYLPTTDSLKAVATGVGDNLGRGSTQVLHYFHEHFLASYIGLMLRRLKRNPQRIATPHELGRFQKLNRLHEKRESRLPSGPTGDTATVTRNADGTISVAMRPPHERYLRRKSLPNKRVIGRRKNQKRDPKVRSF